MRSRVRRREERLLGPSHRDHRRERALAGRGNWLGHGGSSTLVTNVAFRQDVSDASPLLSFISCRGACGEGGGEGGKEGLDLSLIET